VTSPDRATDLDRPAMPGNVRRTVQFIGVCLILSWVPFTALRVLGLDVDEGPGQLVFIVATCGPSLAALMMWLRFRGERLPGRARPSLWWPAAALVLGATSPLLTSLAFNAADISALASHAAVVAAGVGGPLGVLGYTLLAGPLSEEFGWRGYLQPRVRQRFEPVRTAVVVGATWSLWHLPLFFLPGTGQYDKGLFSIQAALFFISWIPISYVILYVSERLRGGVWAAIITHASFNVTEALLPPSGDAGAWVQTALLFAIAGLVGLTWQRRESREPQPDRPELSASRTDQSPS
jgi:uncharacterized protein